MDDRVAETFETWFERIWPELARAMTLIVGNRDAGEDLAATATARAYERWDQLVDPTAWAFTVALNLTRRRWRRQRTERSTQHLIAIGDVRAADTDRDHALWQAVSALPLRQRQAVVLRYVADLPQHEIATLMGCAPGTVAAALHTARRALRERLEIPHDEKEP